MLIGKRIVFVGGLHKSGTSLTHRLLRAHHDVSGFVNTGAPEDEGQHLQSVYPAARAHGGWGRFAFDDSAHLTERSALVSAAARATLLNEWSAYWDLSKPVLVEKSPPNLIRARFLQALFPGSRFVFVVRHPVAVALATQRATGQNVAELVLHWVVAHRLFLCDLVHLNHWVWVRYEDLAARPEVILSELLEFLRLAAVPPAEQIAADGNSRYLSGFQPDHSLGESCGADASRVFERFGYRLDPPYYGRFPGEQGVVTKRFGFGGRGPRAAVAWWRAFVGLGCLLRGRDRGTAATGAGR